MKSRSKAPRKESKREFSRTACRTNVRNLPRRVMRGGYRL